jgi:hAT family C-terminal dimerisation region
MADYFKNYGNNKYKKQVKMDGIEFDNENTTLLNILTLIKFSNVALFWQDKKDVYPELSIAAGIVLGKPTHNACQERVISKGSYMDTKLKKHTSEETFEINVLNACNTHNMTSLNNVITSINNKNNNKRVKMTLSWRCTRRSKSMRQTA